MKRSLAATTQDGQPKKAKLSKLSKQLKLQSKQMDEIIELVASQSDSGTKPVDKNKRCESADSESEDDAFGRKRNSDATSDTTSATLAYQNLQSEIAQLTSVVRKQQEKINKMESMLVRVLSLLESSEFTDPGRRPATSSWQTAPAGPVGQSRRQPAEAKLGRHQSKQNDAGKAAGHANSEDISNSYDQDDGHFTMIVHRTLNDVSRRQRNVVVTGLMEEKDTGKSDCESFVEFCENFMPTKPSLASGNCCKRIGREMDGKPRRLLVHLQSKDAADELIEAAPQLRYCDDSYVASSVFINEDLSPDDAKLAYEARQKRRDRQQRRYQAAHNVAPSEEPEDNNMSGSASHRLPSASPGKNVDAVPFTTSGVPSVSPLADHGASLSAGVTASPGDAHAPSTTPTFQSMSN